MKIKSILTIITAFFRNVKIYQECTVLKGKFDL